MKLPPQINKLVRPDSAVEVHIGESKSRVFRILGTLGKNYFLKISNSAYVCQEIEREIEVLSWLSRQGISVPSTVAMTRQENQIHFLMTAVPGRSLAEVANDIGSKECMRLGARFLRNLHSLDIRTCPFDRSLRVTRKLARANFENGLVDDSDLDEENQGTSLNQLLQDLAQEVEEDLVFTHGDYCFPNIMHHEGMISGVVDLGRAGVADRYQDIGLFLRSFDANIGVPDMQIFLDHYGLIESLDGQKATFFKKLDEFF